MLLIGVDGGHMEYSLAVEGAKPVNIDLVTTKDNGLLTFDIKGGPFWRGTSVKAALGETQLWTRG